MAVKRITIPQSALKQPDENIEMNNNGDRVWTFTFKDEYSTLRSLSMSAEPGNAVVVDGHAGIILSTKLKRISGGYGSLTFFCEPKDLTTDGEVDESSKLLKDLWSCHAVRNDISILAYCGESEGNNPYRPYIEAWMKEPDGELASEHKFTKPDGSIKELPAISVRLANKIEQGIDSVIRHYPLIIRRRVYSGPVPACMEGLSQIEAPPVPYKGAVVDDKTKAQGGIADLLKTYDFLKVQDDADEQSDGTSIRVEGWIGNLKTEGGWDANLYGRFGGARWSMPLGEN